MLFLISLLSISIDAQPCNFQWAHSLLGTSSASNSVTTDAAGDVYVTGYYYGTIDFDPGPAIFNLTASGNLSDAFIQKLTANGDLIWAKSIGGLGWAEASSITTNTAGDVYLTGFYTGTADFDPGAAIFNLTSNGGGDIFIEKLTTNGNFVWAKSIGGLSWDGVNSITTNTAGDIYLTGYYYGTTDFDPGSATFNLTSNGDKDIFVQKLAANGNFIWAKSIGGGTSDEAKSIATDMAGNVYVTGFYTGTADFDPGTSTFNFTSNGSGDIFIEKLTANGNFVWVKSIGGSGMVGDIATSIITDAVGNIYVGGGFSATVDFDPGPAIFNLSEPTNGGSRNIFIEKLDTNGKFIWAKSIGASSNDFVSAMTIDNLGNLYVTGSYFGTVDFDPGPATFNLTATPIDTNGPFLFGNFTEIFIEKLDTNGQFIWA
ncbi:MAG: SBBP repeat-containing protein [Flavobacteriales bacterium]|nr:SBBP repeat-containing protein [Flavobacteriales bacterium]